MKIANLASGPRRKITYANKRVWYLQIFQYKQVYVAHVLQRTSIVSLNYRVVHAEKKGVSKSNIK